MRLDRFQAAQHFGKKEFIFKVHPIIEIGPEPVLLALAVLRHHDDGRLQAGHHPEDKVEQNVWVLIKGMEKEPGIDRDPKERKDNRGPDEFPAPAKFRDHICCPIRDCEARRFLLIGVARNTMSQEIIGAAQSVSESRENPERDIGIFAQKRAEVRPGQDGQPTIHARRRIGRASVPIEQGHFPEKVAVVHFGERRVVSVSVFQTDPDPAVLDQIHGVARFAAMKQGCAGRDVARREQLAQFVSRFVVERAEERYRAQRLIFILEKVEGSVVLVAEFSEPSLGCCGRIFGAKRSSLGFSA